jgi:hypothetical protein
MQTLLSLDFPVHKFGANSVRTTLQYTFMLTAGSYLRQWRPDVILGAVQEGQVLRIYLEADEDWEGRLCFDFPRHRELLGFTLDYPRINSFPEWFVAEHNVQYRLADLSPEPQRISGGQLREGVPIRLKARQALHLTVAQAGDESETTAKHTVRQSRNHMYELKR